MIRSICSNIAIAAMAAVSMAVIALSSTAIVVAPTAGATPCNAQPWPQPIPGNIIGTDLADVMESVLSPCFNIVAANAPDGHDVNKGGIDMNAAREWVVASVTPPVGTPVNMGQPITLAVVPLSTATG